LCILCLAAIGGCGGGGGGTSSGITISDNPLPKEELQSLLDNATADGNIPGAILAIQTPSQTWLGASGVADTQSGEQLDPSMEIRIGGITKMFTAALILKLAEEGKLKLSDSVDYWLPGAMPNSGQITVAMLLNNTSGIFDHESAPEFLPRILGSPMQQWGENGVLDLSRGGVQRFSPGAAWQYCNTDYYILGAIAEAAGKDNVENMMQNRFFGPLGMGRTRLTRAGLLWFPFAHGYCYNYVFGSLDDTSNWNWSWDWTSGSACTNAPDMLIWTRALFSGQVLGSAALRQMITPAAPSANYGFGVYVRSTGPLGERQISQIGTNPGYYVYWAYLPQSDRTVLLILTRQDTSGGAQVRTTDYANAILARLSDILHR